MELRFARLTRDCLFVSFLLFFLGGSVSLADEPISIGTLLSSSSIYDHHMVAITGIARQLELYEPQRGYGCVMYGAYSFLLDDGTGTIQVNVSGSCTPGVVLPVSTGNKVIVEGIFHVTSRDSGGTIRSSPQLESKNIRELAD